MTNKPGYTYMMTNIHNTVVYTGVTSRLEFRVMEHKEHIHPKSFTTKYNCCKLVWYEGFANIEDAILREKQIKGGSRADKEALIHAMNPEWKDLSEGW